MKSIKSFANFKGYRKWVALALVYLSFIFGGILAGIFLSILRGMPEVKELEDYKPSMASIVFDKEGVEIAQWYIERRVPVPLERMPDELKKAVIAVEDKNFFEHGGLDLFGILRAAIANIRARRIVQGGSTITQQLSKVLFLTPEKSFNRKIKEALLAIQIERIYKKRDILELYLNQIYYGSGAYGVQSAARTFFDKDVWELNLAECALISGLPKSPHLYSPLFHPERAITRRKHVLKRLLDEGLITLKEYTEADNTPLNSVKSSDGEIAPYFIEKVRQEAESILGPNLLYRGGLRIYTTLDARAQHVAEDAMLEGVTMIEKRRQVQSLPLGEGGNDDSKRMPEGEQRLQVALISIDLSNGEVLSLVGGRAFNESQFNRATQAKRQPGSAFKPIVYAAAIQNGFTPADIIIDSPVIYNIPGMKRPWKPKNFERRFYGPVRLRIALEKSINIATVKLLEKVGMATTINCARLMGIKSELKPYPSLALGTFEVTLEELTAAYIPFATLGVSMEPVYVRCIKNTMGELLYESTPERRQVITPVSSYIMCSILQGVIQNGTAKSASDLGGAFAGKTGTTDECTDAWFIGFSPQILTGVWVGFDRKISIGRNETGARAALPIWKAFMKGYHYDKPVLGFKEPEDIIFVPIDPENGLRVKSSFPDAILEVFQKGNEPSEYSRSQLKEWIGRDDYYLNYIE